MPCEVIGSGMLAKAFASSSLTTSNAIICAAGVADSTSADESAFRRERELLIDLARRAHGRDSVLVFFSGAPVYGGAPGPRVETAQTIPETPYGHHKLECEILVADSGGRHLVLRLPNIVGPGGHPNQLVPSLVAQTLGGSVTIRTNATRDLLDVDDLVSIVTALLDRGIHNTILNVASGVSTSAPRLAAVIAETLGLSPPVVSIPGGGQLEVSTAKARLLLPEYPRFEPDYPIGVLRRRVPAIATALIDRTKH